MIGPTGAIRVMVATKPVDSAKGRRVGGASARADASRSVLRGRYVFRAKRADRVKLITGTAPGVPVRQAAGGWQVRWPSVQDAVMRLSAAQLSALLEGLDWKRVHAAREMPAPMQPG